jgi:hypothetical protein
MSYTNQTTHYGIPLPTQTDLVNGLDWNTSSEAIDTAIYDAAQAAETAAGDITDIKADIVDLKAADTQFGEDMLELGGRVSTLEQNAATDEADIQDAFDMITDKEVTQAQSDVEVTEGEWFRYNGTLYVATQAIHIGDTIIPNTNCRATNIEDEMTGSGSTVTAADVTYDNTASQLAADDVQEAIDELKGLIDQIGGGGMPTLDFANPLYTFDSNNLTYTATKDCYLLGSLNGSAVGAYPWNVIVSINSTNTFAISGTGTNGTSSNALSVPLTKLRSGDVVTISGIGSTGSCALHVFEEAS